ncbi:7455_t:CDS:2 [Cetraspora pellucida]|uniref:7455_t:CDS:1 n=1 Tax=Cetraspora pellucida TaxID=1433469 RepID=A0ACA9NT41_9GLOM|nr:7455_t:CDS:2 [Cetraspora pellucida]
MRKFAKILTGDVFDRKLDNNYESVSITSLRTRFFLMMSENTNILKFAKRCARCDKQKKKCDIDITLGKFRCTNCKAIKKTKPCCLVQCIDCYEKGQSAKCENCKKINDDPPPELEVYEEDDKIYLLSNDNKYEMSPDTFEKILTIKLKKGFDFGKFIQESVANRIDSFSPQTPTAGLNLPQIEEFGFHGAFGFNGTFEEF